MPESSASLLERLQSRPDAASWERLVDLYRPLLLGWLKRYAVRPEDADDLVQEVLAALVRELPGFHYDRQRGSFRGWLRAILINRLRGFWRKRQHQPRATGDSEFLKALEQLEDPASDLSGRWQREHDSFVARRLLEMIRPEFEAGTWEAFRRVALEGVKPSVAAADLGISVNAVFIAKSRILRRLREEMRGLSD